MAITQTLSQKSLVIIFAYAAAGLGHLRVTEALYHGLPEEVTPLLLRTQDKAVTYMHRLTSIYPWGRKFMEWTQKGLPEEIFTRLYRWYLRKNTLLLYQQMSTILDERIELPKTILIVATHFGLAHQLAALKSQLETTQMVKIYLVVQVTDDSPQRFWYVPGADLTFAPSQKTKEALEEYGRQCGFSPIHFEVLPYPVSPVLGTALSQEEVTSRLHQLNPDSRSNIHTAVPISGAAVGIEFNAKLMETLSQLSDRFIFHVVLKTAPFTEKFLTKITIRSDTRLIASPSTRDIVEKYEELYHKELISLEVTKPSEQAFKALLTPDQKGGVVLLFTKPIGRQEYDNLAFMRRHELIPTVSDQKILWEKAARDLPPGELLSQSRRFRGLILPDDPVRAARFIWWCLKERLFRQMAGSFSPFQDGHENEIGSDGVNRFWQRVARLLEGQPL